MLTSHFGYPEEDPSSMMSGWEDLFRTQSEPALYRMIMEGELDLCQALIPIAPCIRKKIFARLAQVQAQILGIWDAIAAEDERTLKQLLFQKEMALCKDGKGRTPLHLAYRKPATSEHSYAKKRNALKTYKNGRRKA
ncbi:hypothetical protein COOONC_15894 [Cooperia oncophora]